MKNPHRFSAPYPKNPRIPRVKTNSRTKIEMNLKDAHKAADILTYSNVLVGMPVIHRRRINFLIRKLQNAEPELEF